MAGPHISSRRNPLALLLVLALAALPQTTAYLCTEEPPAVRKKEGETCGGACFSEGLCEDGLVCGPSPEDDALAREPGNAQVQEFVDHILGRAAVGVCSKAAPAARELRVLPPAAASSDGSSSSSSSTSMPAPCVGCPSGIDPTGEYVVDAAKAAVALMQEGGFFANDAEEEGGTASLVKVVSGTSQVVAGIKYDLVIAVQRSSSAAPQKTEYYRVDIVSQPWVQPPYRLLGARRLTKQEAEEVAASLAAIGGKGKSHRGLLSAVGEAARAAAARLNGP